MKRVIIIGGGIGGLATANLLAQEGYEVTIYEKNDQLGGRAGQFKKDGFTFDTGPSWYLMPGVFDHYFSLLGTSAHKELDLVRLSPAYKLYSGSDAVIITGNLETDAQTFESYESGSGEKLKQYTNKSKEIYRLALKHFLYSNFDKKRDLLHKDIISRGARFSMLASTPIHSYVSKFISHPMLQQILEYPMVFLGSSPYKAPALYSMMSALDFDEGVYYPKGTMYAVVESLLRIGKRLGVSYKSQREVASIDVDKQGRATGISLVDNTVISADYIISNADLPFTETKLLQRKWQSYPQSYWNKKEPSPSALLMYLGVKGEIPEFEHHTLLFTKHWSDNFTAIFDTKVIPTPASLYISKTSKSDSTAPKGHENIFVLVPLPADISLTPAETEILADTYLAQIKDTTGVDLKSRTVSRTLFGPSDFVTKYNAWQGTMLGPSHILSQSAFFRTPNKSKKVSNLYYVGASTVPGIGVPMCLISAELVLKRIKKDTAA